MSLKIIALAALLASAAPSMAAVFDNGSSFTTVQGAGGFTYGSYNGTSFTAFDSNMNCVIGNITCLRSTTVALPSAFMSDGSAATSGSVILTPGLVIVHPGEFSDSVYVAFTTPTASVYTGSVTFTQQDVGNGSDPHSVGITEFVTPVGGATVFGTRFVVDNVTAPTVTTNFSTLYAAGDTIGFIVDKDGIYYNDSTGIGFSVSNAATDAVPEAATWAMMMAGFGLVGTAMRRRSVALTA